MTGSDLEGADLESRVASSAASAISDDAAGVRAVIEAYGDRLAAADVAGVVSQYTGHRRRHAARARNRRRESAAYGHIRRRFREHAPGVYGPIRRHHRQRRPRGSQGNKPGTITIRATGETQPARLRQLFVLERTGATERSRSTCTSRCRSSQEGAAPASSESATRIRARSASACGRRARRGSGYADVCLPARTGAVQVDAGVARAVRVPALGAPALLAVTAPAHRCTEGNVKAGPAI